MFDLLFLLAVLAAFVWWSLSGRWLAARYLYPRAFWSSWVGRLLGLMLTLSLVFWARTLLVSLLARG